MTLELLLYRWEAIVSRGLSNNLLPWGTSPIYLPAPPRVRRCTSLQCSNVRWRFRVASCLRPRALRNLRDCLFWASLCATKERVTASNPCSPHADGLRMPQEMAHQGWHGLC